MRSLRSAVAAFALAVITFPATASAGGVTGTVTDEISGAGVQGVTVGIGVVPGGLQSYTDTAADGGYSFTDVAAGNHVVCFMPKPGVNLLRHCWHDETVGFYGENIDVPETGTVDHIDGALLPGASVTGTVLDWEGQPLAGICASAWRPQSGGIGRAGDALTDENGRYTIVGLDPGVPNKVVFAPHNSFWRCDGGAELPSIVAQWFDRQESYDSATPLTLTQSEMRAGVDGTLGPEAIPPAGTVRARARCVVPKLRNKTFAAARAALARAGCSSPMPARKTSLHFKRGRVIETKPAAKKRVKRGAAVKLVVSRGR
jgi:hypothetical protein